MDSLFCAKNRWNIFVPIWVKLEKYAVKKKEKKQKIKKVYHFPNNFGTILQ